MDVKFVGGPFDGQVHAIEPEPERDAVVYWPPSAPTGEGSTEIPGMEGVTEYIYRGDGAAHYVGGLALEPDPD